MVCQDLLDANEPCGSFGAEHLNLRGDCTNLSRSPSQKKSPKFLKALMGPTEVHLQHRLLMDYLEEKIEGQDYPKPSHRVRHGKRESTLKI